MKKIGIGFTGAGWMGSAQLHHLVDRDDVDILALYEPNAANGKRVLQDIGCPEGILVSDFQHIIDNPDIEAVWVVSPNSFHAGQSLAAMKAGKHVFCEKPAATRFNDFKSLIEVESQNPSLVAFVDYILYFDTMEERLRGMIADGEFGHISQIQVNYRHPVNITGDKAWKLNKSVMGDAIGMGINHALSVMIYAMSSQAIPTSVYATSAGMSVRGFEADPIWNILIEFNNGAAGFCFGNIDNSNGYDAYHNVFGTEGGFIFDSQLDRAQKVRYWSTRSTDGRWIYPLDIERCKRNGAESLVWSADTTTPDSGNVVEHQIGACINHFIGCIKRHTKSPLSFTNSRVIGEACWAARMSALTGQRVSLPLDWDAAGAFFKDVE